MKIDLHAHSRYSTRPSQWVLQKLGCHECYTEPRTLYQIAKERGMSHVTITDHNTIAGCLEIAHLPDTFISEEITTYFADGCKIHVLAFDLSEEQHRQIQKVRENIFELVSYLHGEGIVHSLAHPLWSINNRLTVEHFEQLLLLFKNFELNGSRDEQLNSWLRAVCQELTPDMIDALAEKHRITPAIPSPWLKNFTGGSDDHSSLHIARIYTQGDASGLPDFLEKINQGATSVRGRSSTPMTLGQNICSIAYQFYKKKYNLSPQAEGNALSEFFDKILQSRGKSKGYFPKFKFYYNQVRNSLWSASRDENIISLIKKEASQFLFKTSLPLDEHEWFYLLNRLSRNLLTQFHRKLRKALFRANFIDLINSASSSGLVYLGMIPYTAAFSSFAADRYLGRDMLQRLLPINHPQQGAMEKFRIAHFTDTFYEINGVALSLRRQVESAQKAQKEYHIITCDTKKHPPQPGIQNFSPIGVFHLPEYREQKLFHPPFLEILDYCYAKEFTQILAATPGPLGLTAMAIARILKLPLWGTYHTALPQYAQYLTGDHVIVELLWKYLVWFYNQMDLIFVPSQSTAEELRQRGVNGEKMRIFPRGVDLQLFHPTKRNGFLENRVQAPDGVKLLYVGRVSKEKNLEILARVFKDLIQNHPDAHLVIVGDGPYLEEMQQNLAGTPCTFTGYLQGEDLAAAYASCDLFLFPSTTDTFGNVVLEAQASGIPVIVTDAGGPQENVIPGKTGLIVRGDSEESLLGALQGLLAQPARLQVMGRAARRYMEERSFETAFHATWKIFEEHAGRQR
ncbi:MAG: glycosyltransferase [Thermodesulfobacteriota bacterium]